MYKGNNAIMTDGALYKKKLAEDYMNDANGETKSYLYALEELSTRINIERAAYKQKLSQNNNKTNKCNTDIFKWKFKPKNFIRKTIPILGWLYTYKWKEWLLKDIIAGFTVAVMNIPQGMAYAMLGNVPPVVGIYMAFFPVLVYAFLGTSRHVSMGSFAVICLMAGNVVTKYSILPNKSTENINFTNVTNIGYSPIEVATTVTFLVGIYQVIMYIFRLGIVCTLLSDTLVSGFTAGAAIHVLSSQIKDVFGLNLKKINGPFKLIYVYIEIFSKINTINIAAAVISAITIVVLVTNNEILKPLVEKRISIPIPVELIVVLIGTLISNYSNITILYNLKTVGDIAVGLPSPKVPNFNLISDVAIDSLIIAIIAYIVSLSMALIFANKLKYEVDANQELLAQGCGNLVGSFFSCLPFSASLSRSVLQQTVGGVTQLASLVSCAILIAVLLWIGPFFEPLPRCILASLIVVALKGILLQAKDIVQIWSTSKLDGIIWLATYLTVICVEIEYGLLIGILISIFILIIKGARGDISILGRLPNTELYLEVESDHKVETDPDITIIRYCGSINFLNKTYFEKRIMKYINLKTINEFNLNKVNPDLEKTKEAVILDFRGLHFVDTSGGKTLQKIINTISDCKIIYIVGLSDAMLLMLQTLNIFSDTLINLMPSIHDAVVNIQTKKKESLYCVRL